MKRLLGLVAAGALIALGAPGEAPAAPITFIEDTPSGLHECLSVAHPTACNGSVGASDLSYMFTLDISDNPGYTSGMLITSADLVLHLSDDGGSGEGGEKIFLTLDGDPVTYTDNANHDAVITLSDFTNLAGAGTLIVVIGASVGDFFFDGARLTVVGDPPDGSTDGSPSAAAVPAPAALVVLALGLAGTAWRRRTAR